MRQPLRTALALALIWSAAWFGGPAAHADAPYQTYYRDHFDRSYRIQAAYRPAGVLGAGLELPDPSEPGRHAPSPLAGPQDMFVDGRGHLFIADTGNNRIVELDPEGRPVRALDVPESPLSGPQGVFVDAEGDIYIADTGNRRIVRLNADGSLDRVYGRPDSSLIPESFRFDPVRLVVDKRGFLYIATLGGYQGLVQLDPEGRFQGFFGANRAPFSLADAVKRLVYTKEMYKRELSKLPGSIASLDIGEDGYIYTVTKELSRGQIKKLNIAGLDQLAGKGEYAETRGERRYGEIIRRHSDTARPQLHDIAIDPAGNMTVIDARLNVISQYDTNGNLLFYWGGEQTGAPRPTVGAVSVPSAVDTGPNGDLYVLDSEQNLIHVFRLTDFGAAVHEANRLTQEGRYEESEPIWREIARQNAFYTPAVIGLAKAAYKRGDYEEAQRLYREAGWAQGYSDAFWQIRLLWFQKRFGLIMNLVFTAAAIWLAAGALRRKRRKRGRETARGRRGVHPVLGQLAHVLTLAKHPIDGFTAIRHEGKAGAAGSTIILALAGASYAVMRAGTHFIFHPETVIEVSVLADLVRFYGLWLLFVVSHYLVSSLRQGEGRFRDIWNGASYALFPFILAGLPITLLSNAMALSERAIFAFLENGVFLWTALLFFWCAQGINNYSVQEAAVNLALTLITMIIGILVMFTVYSLSAEVYRFLYSVWQEVSIR